MAKRTLDDNATIDSSTAGLTDGSTLTKKRKVKHANADSSSHSDPNVGGPSKAERKEQKRLKKLQKKGESDADASETIPDAARYAPTDNDAQKATKTAKKAEKKRLNALRADEIPPASASQNEDAAIEHTPLAAKATSRADQKAERLRMKEARLQAAVPNHSTEEVHVRQPKSERKAEKKRSKAFREAQEASGEGSPIASNEGEKEVQALNGHLTLPSTTGFSGSYVEDASLKVLPQSVIDNFLTSNFIQVTDPKSSAPLRPIMEFSQLPENAHPKPSPFTGFKSPTPIQAASWPFLLAGRDVVGVAETGSGKTLAFGVPCVRYIKSMPRAKGSPARAVIVSPTRELAVQIHEQIVKLAKPAGLEAVCVYGGVPKEGQRFDLKTAQIVVATPGRLNDLIQEGYADLSNVGFVVLDEADRMLDKGFEDAIRQIISATNPGSSKPSNPSRQTLMFTATWPPSIRELASTFMRTPVKITIGDNPTGELRANTRIKQTVEVVDPRDKEMRLFQLLKKYQSGASKEDRILVFCLYKKEATRVEGYLRQKGMRVAAIHGDLSQEKRAASLEGFKKGVTPLLVATDVAARGLDIPAVKVVINVTFPLTVEDYVHRIGRTGRAGADGLAITLFTEHDKAQSGSLINVLKAAGQPVPDELLKFGTTVKKKGHEAYGAFYKDTGDVVKEATKIKFDD